MDATVDYPFLSNLYDMDGMEDALTGLIHAEAVYIVYNECARVHMRVSVCLIYFVCVHACVCLHVCV